MCGISGYCSFERPLDPQTLLRATEALSHRGPDGMRTWISSDGMTGLGHTRLAIIDLETGHQPMCVLGGRFVGVFNGEIYNFRELRTELESLGQSFRTKSDTEVLLLALCQWGPQCLARLDGMFAFAIYDNQERKLLLARDRTGIKPLYYHHGPADLVFASELKSLLAWSHVPRRRHYAALADCLVLGYPLPPATCFHDCLELTPGSFLEFSKRGVRKERYWIWARGRSDWSESQALELLEEQLARAVEEQRVADVPLGAFLSGGLDSSLLAALLARSQAGPVKTFTVKFAEQSYDESQFARTVARHVGSEHHELRVDRTDDGLALAGRVLDQFDQPFCDSSAIPAYLLSQEIRKHVKVVIGGDGGDEMFGGYGRYFYADLARALGRAPHFLLGLAQGVLGCSVFLPPDQRRQARRLLAAATADGGDRLTVLCSQLSLPQLRKIITPDFQKALGGYRPLLMASNGHRHTGGPEMMDATVRTALPADYLRKVDMMSSAHGLEVRVPMLSNRILDFSSQLRPEWKYSGLRTKILLRKLAQLRLPGEIARRKKQGFGIPLDSWLGGSGRRALREILKDARSTLSDLVQPAYSRALLNAFCEREWDRSVVSRYGIYQRVYSLWSLQRWLGRWRTSP